MLGLRFAAFFVFNILLVELLGLPFAAFFVFNIHLVDLLGLRFAAFLVFNILLVEQAMGSKDALNTLKDGTVLKPKPPPLEIQKRILQTMPLQSLRDKHGYLMNSAAQRNVNPEGKYAIWCVFHMMCFSYPFLCAETATKKSTPAHELAKLIRKELRRRGVPGCPWDSSDEEF